MKKLLASLLFFGSFGLAMAQATPTTPTTPTISGWSSFFKNLRSSLSRPPVIPVAPIVRSTARVATPTVVASASNCTDPVEIAYCKSGNTGVLGGCYPLRDRCWGSSVSMDCRPINCSKNDVHPPQVQPLMVTISPVGAASCTPARPMPNCYEELAAAGGAGSISANDIMAKCMNWYQNFRPDFGSARQTFKVSATGGTPQYFINGLAGTQITLSLPLVSQSVSAAGNVTVSDSSNPKQSFVMPVSIYCPATPYLNPRCAGFDMEMKELQNDGMGPNDSKFAAVASACTEAQCQISDFEPGPDGNNIKIYGCKAHPLTY